MILQSTILRSIVLWAVYGFYGGFREPIGTVLEDSLRQSLHPLDVYSTVLEAVAQRIERRWDTDS